MSRVTLNDAQHARLAASSRMLAGVVDLKEAERLVDNVNNRPPSEWKYGDRVMHTTTRYDRMILARANDFDFDEDSTSSSSSSSSIIIASAPKRRRVQSDLELLLDDLDGLDDTLDEVSPLFDRQDKIIQDLLMARREVLAVIATLHPE